MIELITTNHPRIRRGARIIRDETTAKKLILLKWAIQANKTQQSQSQPNEVDPQLQSLKVNHPTQNPLRLTNSQLEKSISTYRKGKK